MPANREYAGMIGWPGKTRLKPRVPLRRMHGCLGKLQRFPEHEEKIFLKRPGNHLEPYRQPIGRCTAGDRQSGEAEYVEPAHESRCEHSCVEFGAIE